MARATTSGLCVGPVGAETWPSCVRCTSKKSVRVVPGKTAVTVTPEPSSSPRSASVMASIANFVAEYAPWNGKAILPTTEADMRELLDVNYMSAFNLTRAVLPHMRAQRRGHIVNVASVVGKIAFPFHGAYSATKFAMIALTEALRGELDGSGVTATTVLPGTTRTDFFDVQRTHDGHVSAPTGPQQNPDVVSRAIVRSVRHPTPEINMVSIYRFAYGLNGFFPFLRDFAGRQFYRRSHGRPRRDQRPDSRESTTDPRR